MIVVDASVLAEILKLSEDGLAIGPRILDGRETLHAPELLDVEIAHVVRRWELEGDLSAGRGGEMVQDLADFAIQRYPHRPFLPRIWQLRHNLTAYDAAYIALAEALDAPLLTRDRSLAKAPHEARVEVV